MRAYFAPRALTVDGWKSNVGIVVSAGGDILELTSDMAEPPRTHEAADPDVEWIGGPLIPGVPNVHSHAFQRALAGRVERQVEGSDNFWTWRDQMYTILDAMTPASFEAVAAQVYMEMLEQGYTQVGEFHYVHHLSSLGRSEALELSSRILAAAELAGIALTLLPTLYMAGGFGGQPLQSGQERFALSVDELLALIELLQAQERPDVVIGLGLHSLRAVSPDALSHAVGDFLPISPGAPIHIHVAEQRSEVDTCLAWSGARPVQWLLDNAPVDSQWCLIHATHTEEAELRAIAKSGAVVGLAPTTEANLGDGVFPLSAFIDVGGRWSVGSDSNSSVSPVEELRWLEYGQRLITERRNVVARSHLPSTGRALLETAVRSGSLALGRSAAGIGPGQRADWVVLDSDHSRLLGREDDDLLDTWLFSGNTPTVKDVMVGGNWVVRDGRHVRRDAIEGRYREAARSIQGS